MSHPHSGCCSHFKHKLHIFSDGGHLLIFSSALLSSRGHLKECPGNAATSSTLTACVCQNWYRVDDTVLNCRMEIITPTDYVGPLMELAQARRGDFKDMTYLTETRTTLVYDMPLAEVRTKGQNS